jgi:hypothetical protein
MARAGAGVVATGVELVRGRPVGQLFQVLGDIEGELVAAAAQPFVVVGAGRQVADHVRRVFAFDKTFVAPVQRQEVLDVAAAAEAARGGREFDLFVLVDAQVGQHKLGPVLVVVAEEDEAQPVAQRLRQIAVGVIARALIPAREAVLAVVLRSQRFKLFGLAQLLEVRRELEDLADLGFLQHAEQRVQVQQRVFFDQAQRSQRTGGFMRAADFGVDQFAGPEHRAFAHDHAGEQRARGLRQGGKHRDEGAFFGREQVIVALADPGQHLVEILQVVERIVENFDHCEALRRLTVFMYSVACSAALAQQNKKPGTLPGWWGPVRSCRSAIFSRPWRLWAWLPRPGRWPWQSGFPPLPRPAWWPWSPARSRQRRCRWRF